MKVLAREYKVLWVQYVCSGKNLCACRVHFMFLQVVSYRHFHSWQRKEEKVLSEMYDEKITKWRAQYLSEQHELWVTAAATRRTVVNPPAHCTSSPTPLHPTSPLSHSTPPLPDPTPLHATHPTPPLPPAHHLFQMPLVPHPPPPLRTTRRCQLTPAINHSHGSGVGKREGVETRLYFAFLFIFLFFYLLRDGEEGSACRWGRKDETE